jgi:hypothetical protein
LVEEAKVVVQQPRHIPQRDFDVINKTAGGLTKILLHRVTFRCHHSASVCNVLPPRLLANLSKDWAQLFEASPGFGSDGYVSHLSLAITHCRDRRRISTTGDLIGT